MTIKTQNQFPIKLDAYDKKILYSLYQNARKPQNQLAKEVGISPQRLKYKLDRLFQTLISPTIQLNLQKLKIESYFIFAKTLSSQTIKKLKTSSDIFFLAEFIGKYKYLIFTYTEDIRKFSIEYLGEEKVETYHIINSFPDNFNPFGIKQRIKEAKHSREKIKLTNQDYNILKELQESPLSTSVELSYKLKIDRRTIKKRIDQMQKNGAIERFRYVMDIFKMGLITYFIKIKFTSQDYEKLKSIIQQNNYSGYLYESYNELLFLYTVPSHKELSIFTKAIQKISSKIEIDINQITEYEITNSGKIF